MYLNLINQLVIKKTNKQTNIWINKEREKEGKLPSCESNKTNY